VASGISIQAYAERIDLVLGYGDDCSSAKPKQLAVIDDGHGMDPGMLRLAMMWGGNWGQFLWTARRRGIFQVMAEAGDKLDR
jgi:hypothetical protein